MFDAADESTKSHCKTNHCSASRRLDPSVEAGSAVPSVVATAEVFPAAGPSEKSMKPFALLGSPIYKRNKEDGRGEKSIRVGIPRGVGGGGFSNLKVEHAKISREVLAVR